MELSARSISLFAFKMKISMKNEDEENVDNVHLKILRIKNIFIYGYCNF
ncbi:hypothetical protein Leryth_015244 [Lithospermum erythrorhizon]|nr:hypothetical protein Leryth_015244 [Lithospermum erythrorhizon]